MTQCKSCGWISVELVNICECCGSFIEQPKEKEWKELSHKDLGWEHKLPKELNRKV